jgi:hypothetical protein
VGWVLSLCVRQSKTWSLIEGTTESEDCNGILRRHGGAQQHRDADWAGDLSRPYGLGQLVFPSSLFSVSVYLSLFSLTPFPPLLCPSFFSSSHFPTSFLFLISLSLSMSLPICLVVLHLSHSGIIRSINGQFWKSLVFDRATPTLRMLPNQTVPQVCVLFLCVVVVVFLWGLSICVCVFVLRACT